MTDYSFNIQYDNEGNDRTHHAHMPTLTYTKWQTSSQPCSPFFQLLETYVPDHWKPMCISLIDNSQVKTHQSWKHLWWVTATITSANIYLKTYEEEPRNSFHHMWEKGQGSNYREATEANVLSDLVWCPTFYNIL